MQELKLLEDGIVAYDAAMQSDVLIVSPVLCFLCDNPRAAQMCSHLGSSTGKLQCKYLLFKFIISLFCFY